MKSNRRINSLLGLAGLVLTAGVVRAADVSGGFTLPSQTHWGVAVLAPGHYTFVLDHSTPNSRLSVRRGTETVATVLAQGVDLTGSSGASFLQIVAGRVRSLHLACAGMTYRYKRHEREEAMEERSDRQGVLVSVNTR
jgi:hypothetical protein